MLIIVASVMRFYFVRRCGNARHTTQTAREKIMRAFRWFRWFRWFSVCSWFSWLRRSRFKASKEMAM